MVEERAKKANKMLYTEDNIKADLKLNGRVQTGFIWINGEVL
jgi:hypothetical protein